MAASPERPSVAEQIARGNYWYVGSQFAWASRPSIRPIYQRRFEFFTACIERTRARLGSPVRVLDAGCGDGYWLTRLGEIEGVELTGVDYNPLRVERAREVARDVSVVLGDMTTYRPPRPFDVLLLSQIIEHVEDDVGLLRTTRGLLRPGGCLILGTPNEGSRLQRWRVPADTDHVHFYTEPEIRAKIERAGFVVDSVMREVFYVGIDWLYYGLARRRWGFRLLEWMTRRWPSECSDYYFECPVPG